MEEFLILSDTVIGV